MGESTIKSDVGSARNTSKIPENCNLLSLLNLLHKHKTTKYILIL